MTRPMTTPRILLLSVFALLLAGCGPMSAQNPGGAYSPVNALAEADEAHLLLGGADVVAYFTEGAYRPGRAEFSSQHEGVTLRFASAEHKDLFDQAPDKYLPRFGGYCANGIAYGIPWGGDADSWRIIDGKLYIFGGQGSKAAFELDVPASIARQLSQAPHGSPSARSVQFRARPRMRAVEVLPQPLGPLNM